MQHKSVPIILLVACVAAPFLVSDDAQAKYSRHNANDCTTRSSYQVMGDGAIRNSTGGNITLYCALYDANDYTKGEIDKINVHVYDGPGNVGVYAKACTNHYYNSGGSCGPWSYTGSNVSGNFTLKPSLGALSYTYDFGFLAVQLSSNSQLRGYYTQD